MLQRSTNTHYGSMEDKEIKPARGKGSAGGGEHVIGV